MTDAARQEIFSKIKIALKAEAHHQNVSVSDDRQSPAASDLQEQAHLTRTRCEQLRNGLIKQFEAELTRAGGYFYLAEDAQSACEHLLKIAAVTGAKRAVGWNWPVWQCIGLGESLRNAGIEFIADDAQGQSDEFTANAIDADIGITGAHYALADTGTLVLLSGKGCARSASLLPPVHVAIVETRQIISTLDDLFILIKAEGDPPIGLSSAITFVTGPSRTADIELVLVVGVHGPQQLYVMLLDS